MFIDFLLKIVYNFNYIHFQRLFHIGSKFARHCSILSCSRKPTVRTLEHAVSTVLSALIYTAAHRCVLFFHTVTSGLPEASLSGLCASELTSVLHTSGRVAIWKHTGHGKSIPSFCQKGFLAKVPKQMQGHWKNSAEMEHVGRAARPSHKGCTVSHQSVTVLSNCA